jgi:fibronectin type 3 domain-containing protein
MGKFLSLAVIILALASVTFADVPNRVGVRGTVPNPGTQQQELGNITFPAPYNVFEFVVTCMACHGGTIDQQTAHGGNWAGSAMASAARDPIFRANQMIVNNAVKNAIGKDGAGNMCFRCHSPNGWLSGRFDPTLNGAADGSTMIHTILLSTDDEGIMCETCHRSIGAVTMKRPDLDPMDAVWNMMADIDDWPHSGGPYQDQAGDMTIAAGNPYGDTTLQFADGMTYGGRYDGYVLPFWSDIPIPLSSYYTGQTYGIYPPGTFDNLGNDISGQPAFNPDGSLPIQYDVPIGPPLNPNGTPCYSCQSVSLEHPTFGPSFVEKAEFCGSCHELTVPVLNHGMPEQRTFSEWKFSAFGQEGPDHRTCQSCHMPRLSHEYSDGAPVTLNADPVVSGWYPYAKSRTNTAVHKLAGANRDLPMIMKELYPEVDFEVIGGGEGANGVWVSTGNDPRIFPGMLSTRDSMWDRNQRNTEISLHDGVDIQIVNGPTWNAIAQKWEVQVKVINNTGHRIPSGYPDGRRLWISLEVQDNTGAVVYESGHYDPDTATLFTDGSMAGLNRALSPVIDDANNAVMIYERVTGTCTDDGLGNLIGCTPSLSLLNDTILFDNRIPPYGFNYAQYRESGVKFWNYNPATCVPYEDVTRFGNGMNFDLITYAFSAPDTAQLAVRAEAYWETHTREFMEHLRVNDTSTVRPQGPARVWDVNYPLAPNYLSDEYGLSDISAEIQAAGFINEPLRDNWGGIAYAAWYRTGKGAPYLVAVADTAAATLPAPTGLQVNGFINPDTNLVEPYTQVLNWNPVAGADGYVVWIKYGPGLTTASWDKLAIVQAPATELINTSLNVDKTYIYAVQAFNGAGFGPASTEVAAKTPWDLPLPPENLQFVSSTSTSISMTWFDASDNEDGWIVRRRDVPSDPNVLTFPEITRFVTANMGGFGGVSFIDTDAALQPGRCYNYVVEAYNSAGNSGWNVNGPVQMCTGGGPGAPSNLVATAISGSRVDLTWVAGTGDIAGYRVERSTDAGSTWPTSFNIPDPAAISYSDLTVSPNTTFWYRVFAYNGVGDSLPSNVAQVTTPVSPPAAPTLLSSTAVTSTFVDLTWSDNSNNETGFTIDRSDDGGATWATVGSTQANINIFRDATVQPKWTYQYRIYAFNAGGPSALSNMITVVTPGEIPQAPSNLRVASTTKNSITINWRDNSTNEQGFYIERSPNGTDSWSRIATVGIDVQTYKNVGLQPLTTYWYRVQAFNADGVSEFSNVVAGRTKK